MDPEQVPEPIPTLDPVAAWITLIERRIFEFRDERGVEGVNVYVRLRNGERFRLRQMYAGPVPGMIRLEPAVEALDETIVGATGIVTGIPLTPTERIVLLLDVVEVAIDARKDEDAKEPFGFAAARPPPAPRPPSF